jgi:hypothetical protein
MAGLCHWATTAPAGLCDAAEGWGMTELPNVFLRAHARFQNHDDGSGHCKVCGAQIDFEAWLDAQDAQDALESSGGADGGAAP